MPEELLEAARIDGAGTWTRFWRITVPLLSPTIFFAVVVGTIYAFQTFGAIDILIGSQNAAHRTPTCSSTTSSTRCRSRTTPGRPPSWRSSLFLILLGLTLLQLRFLERRVHYAR